jgi:hypothetical protein
MRVVSVVYQKRHSTAQMARWLTKIAIAGGILLRFAFLDADPIYEHWLGYITDEGRWTEQARNLALFGTLNPHDLSFLHLLFAPLFQALTFVSFSLFSVDFFSARIVCALSGSALLLAVLWFFRNRITLEAQLFIAAALATQSDLLFLSRVAIPEMAAIIWEFLAFSVLVTQPYSVRKAMFAGVLIVVGLSMKATIFPLLGIFSILILILPREIPPTLRWRRLLAFWLPVSIASVVGTMGIIQIYGLQSIGSLLDFFGHLKYFHLKYFFAPNSLYGIASFFFERDFIQPVNLLLLGVWIATGIFVVGGTLPKSPLVLIYYASGVWIIGWIFVSAGMRYFPQRYVFHVLPVLIIHIGVAISLLQSSGVQTVLTSLCAVDGRRRMLVALWLSLTLAVIISPLLSEAAAVIGFTIDRLRERIPMIAVLDVILASIVTVYWRYKWPLFGVIIVPLIATLSWFWLSELGALNILFWPEGNSHSLNQWLCILVASILATVLLLIAFAWGKYSIRRVSYIYLFGFVALWIWQIAPSYFHPSYTIAKSSAALETLLADHQSVRTVNASSLFIANKIKYNLPPQTTDELPEVLVVAFNRIDHKLQDNYSLLTSYDIHVHRDYWLRRPNKVTTDRGTKLVKIYCLRE